MYDDGEETKFYKYNSKHDIFTPNITNSICRTYDYYDVSIETMVYHNNLSEGVNSNTIIIKDFNCRNDISKYKDYNYLKQSLKYKYDGIDVSPELSSNDYGNTKCIFPNKILFEYFE